MAGMAVGGRGWRAGGRAQGAPACQRDKAGLRPVDRAVVLDGGQVALEAAAHVCQLLRAQQAARRQRVACRHARARWAARHARGACRAASGPGASSRTRPRLMSAAHFCRRVAGKMHSAGIQASANPSSSAIRGHDMSSRCARWRRPARKWLRVQWAGTACACGSVRGAPDRGTVSASTPSSRDTSFSVSQHPVVTSCAAAPSLG